MDLKIVERIRLEASRLSGRFRGMRWYAFGSWSRDDADFEDIDVLVVYGDGIDSEAVRSELRGLRLSMPLDLYMFHESEETQFKFIEGQECRVIYVDGSDFPVNGDMQKDHLR